MMSLNLTELDQGMQLFLYLATNEFSLLRLVTVDMDNGTWVPITVTYTERQLKIYAWYTIILEERQV